MMLLLLDAEEKEESSRFRYFSVQTRCFGSSYISAHPFAGTSALPRPIGGSNAQGMPRNRSMSLNLEMANDSAGR